jgi:DNA-repair protein complementing XP-A cells
MMLYVRYQVEEFAWKKWGSPEALDAEFYRREEEKKRKRGKKFEEGLRDLRRRTKEGIWQKRQDERHVHVFGAVEKKTKEEQTRRTRQASESDEEGVGTQRCEECGFTIEVEVF